jgi:hypothetical protein
MGQKRSKGDIRVESAIPQILLQNSAAFCGRVGLYVFGRRLVPEWSCGIDALAATFDATLTPGKPLMAEHGRGAWQAASGSARLR